MDAVKFIEERNRMCESFGDGCTGCPASNACKNELCCAFDLGSTAQIAVVEEWSAAHPRKTRQSVFLEQWPEACLDEYGILLFCPRYISAAYRDVVGSCKSPEIRCKDCHREFWMQEVE